jgi:hypothetical protein
MNISIFGYKLSFSYESLIFIGILYIIIFLHTFCSCCNLHGIKETFQKLTDPTKSQTKKKEGFAGASTNQGESASYSLNNHSPIDTSKWNNPNLSIMNNKPISQAAQDIINRPNQSLPLPNGQLSIFDNMPFSPECCPNTYSSSMGCACMNPNTYNYLINRGGNNLPYSEY